MTRRWVRVLLVALALVAATVSLKAAEGQFWTLDCSVDRPWLLLVDDPLGTPGENGAVMPLLLGGYVNVRIQGLQVEDATGGGYDQARL